MFDNRFIRGLRRTLLLGVALALTAVAEEPPAAEPAAAEPAVDAELEFEIAYVEALVENRLADFAEGVSESVKRRWPAAETRLFAIEVRMLLSQNKFEEAEQRIAALPTRSGVKYWAARLEVANNLFRRNRKQECMAIYDEFFKTYATPPKEIAAFYNLTKDIYAQLLVEDRQYLKAADVYAALMKTVKREQWCPYAAEAAKLYLKVAEEAGKGKAEPYLKSADDIVKKLLWRQDEYVFFGQAVAMRAHIEELRGRIDLAEQVIADNLGQLEQIHADLLAADPQGSYLRLSPLPECLYLRAKMRWRAAQTEFAKGKGKRDDERVKALMFGDRLANGKRDGNGAYNFALRVFLNYETSPWALSANAMVEEIQAFAEKEYAAKIRTRITREQLAKVRAAQFKTARELFLAERYREAADAYFEVLRKFPELAESVDAVGSLITCYQNLASEAETEEAREAYRLDLDAIEGYLAERFAEFPDRAVMIAAGNQLFAAATREQERGEVQRAKRLFREFYSNYRAHPNAPALAAAKATEAQQAGEWREAASIWELLGEFYPDSSLYSASLSQLASCYGKLGEGEREIACLKRYLEVESSPVRHLQGEMQLAQLYQRRALELLASTNEVESAAGIKQIVYAIKCFNSFSEGADRFAADPSATKVDKEKFVELKEAAVFLAADCYSRIVRPEQYVAKMRQSAIAGFEKYVAEYPAGKYVKTAYVRLGSLYTAAGDTMKSKDALDRLTRNFPDSDEAKNALPRLAKSLIEIGMAEEGAKIYAEMIGTDGKYTAAHYLAAGDALAEAGNFKLAASAYAKAARLANPDQQAVTLARARMGVARSEFRQGELVEAYEALESFLGDQRMARMSVAAEAHFLLVDVASALGEKEAKDELRGRYFGEAIASLNRVASYWKDKKPWERDNLRILAGEVLIRRMRAEERMHLEEAALKTCANAAALFQSFVQTHAPNEARTFADMEDGERANLERAYAAMIPLYSRLGSDYADFVFRYAREYLELFPEGKDVQAVNNCLNRAKADLPAGEGEMKNQGE